MAVSLHSYSLADLPYARAILGLASGDTSRDDLITYSLNSATDLIENYTGRRFKLTEYTDVEYDATGIDQLILNQRPITEFTSLEMRDGSLNESDWQTVEENLYFVDTSAAVLDLNFNATGRWNRYRVSYTAGYDTIPSDLAGACATLAAFLVENPLTTSGVKSKQEGQRKIEYYDRASNTASLLEQLNLSTILDPYCNSPVLADK